MAKNDEQKVVDDMAAALKLAEVRIEAAAQAAANVIRQAGTFRKRTGKHPSTFGLTLGHVCAATGFLGNAAEQMTCAHDELDRIRGECNLPDPSGPVVQGGGGGGK